MSFFDAADDSERERYRPPAEPEWQRIPNEVLPTPLTLSTVVARGRQVAIVLHGIQVYPTGFLFTVRGVRHPEVPSHDPDFTADMNGFNHPTSAERFRLGIEYADGRSATNDWPPSHGSRGEAPPASLRGMGGSGGGDGAAMEFWAWPIPAEGDVNIVTAWPVRDVPEGKFVLPGDLLREAAVAATPIWPDAPSQAAGA